MGLSLIMPYQHKEQRAAVLAANAEFRKSLYAVLARSPGNVCFSPISIHAILSLMYQGARGRTKEAFSRALSVADEEIAALGYQDVMTRLNKANYVTLHIANKIFLQDTYELQDAFKRVAQNKFLSEVDLVNFREASAAAKSINTWVEKKTNNKIKDVFNPNDITDDTALVLVNAIYFKGKWLEQFNVTHTSTEKFYLNDIDTVDVQMMFIKKKFFYKRDEELAAQVLRMSYVNTNFSMIIILPRNRNGIAELEEKLAHTDLTKITENMISEKISVSLPKFKIEQTIDLRDPLTQLGLGEIFTKDADFSGLIKTSRPLYVSKAVQKVFIDVNEEGTEAVAVTYHGVRMLCASRTQRFIADHPFVVILAADHEASTSVLFQGRISHPLL